MWPRPCASTSVYRGLLRQELGTAPHRPWRSRCTNGCSVTTPSVDASRLRTAFGPQRCCRRGCLEPCPELGESDPSQTDLVEQRPAQTSHKSPANRRPSKPAGPGSPRVGRFDSFAAPWGHLQGLLAPSGFETTTNGVPTPRRGPSSLARHRVQRIWPNRAPPRQRFGVRGAVFDALAPGGRNRLSHGDTRGTRWQPRPRDSCAGSRVRRPRRREALPFAPRRPAAVAAVRSHRRTHGLGDPRTTGPRVREHRGRVAGGRPLRYAGGPAAVRRAGQLEDARHGADCRRGGGPAAAVADLIPKRGRPLRRTHGRDGDLSSASPPWRPACCVWAS